MWVDKYVVDRGAVTLDSNLAIEVVGPFDCDLCLLWLAWIRRPNDFFDCSGLGSSKFLLIILHAVHPLTEVRRLATKSSSSTGFDVWDPSIRSSGIRVHSDYEECSPCQYAGGQTLA